jgi:hypothetical protein
VVLLSPPLRGESPVAQSEQGFQAAIFKADSLVLLCCYFAFHHLESCCHVLPGLVSCFFFLFCYVGSALFLVVVTECYR